jgi:hypothetical protein
MTLSDYFYELDESYRADLDDLRFDSDGRDVLQSRLKDKRSQLSALVPLIGFDPVLVAPVFHGAFEFPSGGHQSVADLLSQSPGEFPPWQEVAAAVTVVAWAQPLVKTVLANAYGEDFLATVVALEFALSRRLGPLSEQAADASDDGDDRDDRDDREDGDEDERLSEDYLEQQGFERRSKE